MHHLSCTGRRVWRSVPRQPADRLRHQYLHVTDVTPTLLDLAGVAPLGRRQAEGRSARRDQRRRDPPLPGCASRSRAQYTETAGNRAYQTGRWKIVTAHRYGAPSRRLRVAALRPGDGPHRDDRPGRRHPEVVAELAARWERAAWTNRVFPLDDHGPGSALRRPDRRPLRRAGHAAAGNPDTGAVPVRPAGPAPRCDDHRARFCSAPATTACCSPTATRVAAICWRSTPTTGASPLATALVNAYGLVRSTASVPLALGEQDWWSGS